MTAQLRAAVWLDHREARVFHVDLDGFDEKTIPAPVHRFHRHAKGPSAQHDHPDDERQFFAAIAAALVSAEEVLVLGPSTAKSQLLKFFNDHARELVGKVVAVETSDHPTDAQIVAHAKRHFQIPTPRVD